MILVTERDHLNAALSRVASIVDKKNTIPILSHIHLTAGDSVLTIRATNGDMETVETIWAEVGVSGITTVSAELLAGFVKNLPEGAQIGMKLGERLGVTSGRSRINLGILDPVSFPTAWSETWPTQFEIMGEHLAEMIGRVAFAQSTDLGRTYINGVFMTVENGNLRFVATDSNVLAYSDGPEMAEFPPVTVPARMVSELANMSGTVTIGISDSKISAQSGNSTITSKLIDPSLKYPDYKRIIPVGNPNVGSVNIAALIGATRRAMLSGDEGKRQTVRLNFSETLQVSARNDKSDALDEIDVEYEGEEIELPFNPGRLIDILTAIKSERAHFELGDRKAVTVWKGDDEGLSVICPQAVS